MPDPNGPGDVSPDLPPEYAEAYRRGYERAYGSAPDDTPEQAGPRISGPLFADEVEPEPEPPSHREPEPPSRREPAAPEPDQPDESRPTGGAHRADTALLSAVDDDPRERPAWLVPALLAGAVVVLLLGAYLVGRVVSNGLSGTDVADEKPDGVVLSEDGSTAASPEASGSDEPNGEKPRRKKYGGAVDAARITGVTANCTYPSSVDSGGNKVTYGADKVADGDLTTAWRCAGSGDFEQVVIDFGKPTKVGEVGLIPGYAKTDPRSGVDRYAENHRLTSVTWIFDGGRTQYRQRLNTSPSNRSMQTMRIPATTARRVVIGVGTGRGGTRDTIAISEVRIGRAID